MKSVLPVVIVCLMCSGVPASPAAAAGEYLFEWIQPADGAVLRAERFKHAGGAHSVPTPVYALDLALRVRHVTELR